MRGVVAVTLAVAVLGAGCGRKADERGPISLDAAAQSYVRLALALGERDADSLDSYHGPAAWQVEARARHATLADIRVAEAAVDRVRGKGE